MLLRGAFKWDSFLATVHRYVTGGEGRGVPKVDPADGVAYLGAGYWRAVLWLDPSNRLYDEPPSDMTAITLINPDRSYEEIQAVELGVAVLARLEYVEK
jgi:hypothetical protein